MYVYTIKGIPFTGTPGLQVHMDGTSPIDFFNLFMTEEVKELILTESVRYDLEDHEEYLRAHKYARAHDLRRNPMKKEEINTLFAIFLTMGILDTYAVVTYYTIHYILLHV